MRDTAKEEAKKKKEEQKRIQEEQAKEMERKAEEERLNEQRKLEEHKKAQEQLEEEYKTPIHDNTIESKDHPEKEALVENSDVQNVQSEEKKVHEVTWPSPDFLEPPTASLNEFLKVLVDPSVPESTKRDMFMMYPYSQYRPLPRNIQKLECTIRRDKSSLAKKMYPRYHLMTTGGEDFLLAAQRVNLVGSAHYVITLRPGEIRRVAAGFLGKVRSNDSGLEYNLFGTGENPSKGLSPEQTRNQYAGVYYVRLVLTIGANPWEQQDTSEDARVDTEDRK